MPSLLRTINMGKEKTIKNIEVKTISNIRFILPDYSFSDYFFLSFLSRISRDQDPACISAQHLITIFKLS
jgi:hypothetical protein